MLSIASKFITYSSTRSNFQIRFSNRLSDCMSLRCYHSYPDPNEKPRITTTKSTSAKRIDKSTGVFDIDKKFRLDEPFPGIVLGKPITDSTTPKTISSKLQNGLMIATQENPGLMSSFSFVVRTGRYG